MRNEGVEAQEGARAREEKSEDCVEDSKNREAQESEHGTLFAESRVASPSSVFDFEGVCLVGGTKGDLLRGCVQRPALCPRARLPHNSTSHVQGYTWDNFMGKGVGCGRLQGRAGSIG